MRIGSKIIILLVLLISASPSNALIKTVTFGTDASYAPFEYYDAISNQISGYDIDIANALCRQMRANCVFKNVPWQQLLPGLQKGEFDAVIRAVSITDARSKVVDFTQPYYSTTGSFVAATNSHLTLSKQNLAGSLIGVERDTTFERYLRANYSGILDIKIYPNIQEALVELMNNRVDLVLGDTPVIKNWVNNQTLAQYEILGQTTADKSIFGTGFGIAVRKGNSQLVSQLNTALAEIKADGIHSKITRQYFGADTPT